MLKKLISILLGTNNQIETDISAYPTEKHTDQIFPQSIIVNFVFLDCDSNKNANIGFYCDWSLKYLILDVGFRDNSSKVLVRFLWDNKKEIMHGVFVPTNVVNFEIIEGWIYYGVSSDGSGTVERAWTLRAGTRPLIKLEPGNSTNVTFDFDSKIRTVQN